MENILNVKEYPVVYDIIRIVTIQVVTQLLFVINNNDVTFFNITFIKTLVFLCLGVLTYWLVIKKFIDVYVNKEEDD